VTTNGQDWNRLAALLVARRAELGYPGKGRAAFARARNLSHTRTIDDLENARRTNFEPATLAQVEQVYGWKTGSITAVLAGGEPTPLTVQSRTVHDSISVTDSVTAEVRYAPASIDRLVLELYESGMPQARDVAAAIRAAEARLQMEVRIARERLTAWRGQLGASA
jgi:hypothetical protein